MSAPVVHPATDFDGAIEAAASALVAGQPIILPTDTIYGVAARAADEMAIAKLFALKSRSDAKPVAVLVSSASQLQGLTSPLSALAQRLVERHWPGPLTLVLGRDQSFEVDLGGDAATIGVRCPDHDFVRGLAERVGPLATTSANPSGQATPASPRAAADSLMGPVGLIVNGGKLSGLASTVVAVRGSRLEVLRPGAIAADDL